MKNITTGTVITLDSSVFGCRRGNVSVYVTGDYKNFFSVDIIGFEIETKSVLFYRGALDGYETSFKIGGLTYRAVPVRHTLDKFDMQKSTAKIKSVEKMSYDDFVAREIERKTLVVEAVTLSR